MRIAKAIRELATRGNPRGSIGWRRKFFVSQTLPEYVGKIVVIFTFVLPSQPDERFVLFAGKLATWTWPSRAVARDPEAASSISTYTTKVGFGANTLTNIPSFRHEQDLNPGGSRMEIYETISHVSTNQVWLHINSASSRVYFRPIALFSFVGSGWRGPTCQKLPVPRPPFTPVPRPLIHWRSCLSLPHDNHLFSFLIRPTPGMHAIVGPLSYSSLSRSYP